MKQMRTLDLETEFKRLEDLIAGSKNFFLAGHLNPDGDTIGCMLAIGSVLKRLGKKVWLFSQDPVPDNLAFLPNARAIKSRLPASRFDVAILLECSTPARGGALEPVLRRSGKIINIDHHKTSEFYGDINIVEPHSSSTAEIVYRLFYNMKVNISRREAACLYTGMVTDTGRFHFAATSPRTLEVASRLLETGFKFSHVNDLLYATKARESLKILGRALESLELKAGGRLAVLTLRQEDFKAFDARSEHSESVINYGLMPPGVKAAVMFREEPELVNVTFRSVGHLDVSMVAKSFGGGGHRNAAGCRLKGTLQAAREQVLAVLTRLVQ
ncbi:MAG: bifunctional oligoribonuclease/PAP phosphatase NrnA [Elusimicrobia bacterium CG08_land_8_20_14_0_20_59_10]|nr:MAG: bifunctional oligoribonuclease/PAP phosphatase NrnA [Elusimicrobia bacterium CG08_land_8_20_14_0_20_59_10]